jgi:hypothetical protein
LWAAAVGLVGGSFAARADDPAKPAPKPKTAKMETKQAYMGVNLEPIPHVLASQMPGVIPKGQGVLVGFVEKGSPADKAGLRTDDVLLTFDKKDVVSAEQLIDKVRGEKPGAKVAVGVVRGGKAVSTDVTLGEREKAAVGMEQPFGFRMIPDEQFRKMFENGMGRNVPSGWESFDSMKLTRTDGDKWKADVDYRTKDGKKEHKTFEGTREEIRKDIQADKNLTSDERENLIRVINGNGLSFDFQMPWSDMFNQQPANGGLEVPPKKAPTTKSRGS